MFTVSKTFTFCYGHRLQNDSGKCRNLHGHTARATFIFEGDKLDDMGMVMHFDLLKQRIGLWISEQLDHSLLLNESDPIASALRAAGERFTQLPFDPTAENLARMLFEKAHELGLPVKTVDVWESETSKASYADSSR